MLALQSSAGRKAAAALVAAGVELALAAAVLWGLATHSDSAQRDIASLVTIALRTPPSPTPTPEAADPVKPDPPAPKAEAEPVVAAPAPVELAQVRPAAPVAGEGSEASAGAARAGAGTGGGGIGEGSGGGAVTQPVRIAGALGDRDYPREAARVGAAGTVAIRFRVRTDGRVDRCTVLQSSDFVMLDRLTCDLVEARFDFIPARDATGRAVDATLRTSFTWGIRQRR